MSLIILDSIQILRGKRIMVVESAELVNPVISRMYHELEHSVGIRQFEIPPEDIDKYIEKNIFDGAIIHTSSVLDETLINKLHAAGVKMVVLKRDLLADGDEAKMNKRIEGQGIITLSKSFSNYFQAFERLAEIFEKEID